MKKLLLLLLPLFSFSQKCWHEEHKDKHFYYVIPKINIAYREHIDMTGVSTFTQHDKSIKFSKIDTKCPKIRETRKMFKHFVLKIHLGSNDDTGNDRLTILYAYSPIYTYTFGENEDIELHFNFSDWEKLQFIVDNPLIKNGSPGAFNCIINIKEIKE